MIKLEHYKPLSAYVSLVWACKNGRYIVCGCSDYVRLCEALKLVEYSIVS